MIELKNITTVASADGKVALKNYSLQVKSGEVCCLPGEEGRTVIQVLLGFIPVESGYVSFDGTILTPKSAPFLRRTIAYVPEPVGFEDADDVAKKQYEMVDKALKSDSSVLLAVTPASLQDAIIADYIKNSFRTLASKGKVVIVNE